MQDLVQVDLLDDGTLDTVVEVSCGDREPIELRYSAEVRGDFCDENGFLDEDALFEFIREDIENSWPWEE